MNTQKLAIKEQLVKTVVKSGNGGAVWVPKNWLGQEVIVILPDKPKLNVKEKVIHLLEPYLKDVIAVFIYGSYARHEETKDSDLDVMVVTKDKTIAIEIKEPNLEISVFQLDKLKMAIEKYPVMYYQIVQEAVPLINFYVLNELKNIKIDNENFKKYINETKEHIESNKELIGLDKLDDKYVKSYSVLYSTVLRLRGLFIIKCILNKEKFSNKAFQEWLIQNRMTHQEFEQCYATYRAVKNDKSTQNLKIEISVAEKLLNILIQCVNSIEAELYGK
ncbi:nucleotidyltransferase domain-containing protein [Candidatus Woesearchaeota archaeon]|nr:nucleotidyltransferase domain-containing protein [Candidatus Woesearchaeota archaeon]